VCTAPAPESQAAVAAVHHQHPTVGQQREAGRVVELRLRRSAVPVPPLAIARHRAHLLQVGAQHADAVVLLVHHQHAPVGQQLKAYWAVELRLRRGAVTVPPLAIARHRAHLLQVGAQHADAVVAAVRHQHPTVGQQCEVGRPVEVRLRRSAVPVPPLAVARHRAHLLQVGAQHADAAVVLVPHQHTPVG
jgi:hypothetical protein